MKKEIKEDIIRWKDLLNSWFSKINVVKMTTILPKSSYRVNTVPFKIPTKSNRN